MFFTQIVGLSAAQVGVGLTVAGIVSFFFAVPAGKLADRVGTKRIWAIGAGLTAALYFVWPLIDGFAAYLVMMVALEVVSQAGWSGRGAYTIDIFTREERVQSQAFMRAALNIGFTLGALIGGLALATNSDDVVRAVPILTGLVLLQVAAARGVDSVARSLRASYISTGFFVLSCAIVLVTHDTIGWVTIFLVWLGHVTVTGAELYQSAGHWGFMSELTDSQQRAEYQGAAHIGGTLGSVWAPALYTWLAMEHGSLGWIAIAAIVIVSTLTMSPAARAAERYLARHGSAA